MYSAVDWPSHVPITHSKTNRHHHLYSSFKTSYRPRASIIDYSLNFYTPIITYLNSPHSKLVCIIPTLTIFASCIVVFNNNTAIQITEIVYVLKLLKLSYFINNNTVISNNRILVRTVVIYNNTVIQIKLCKFKLSYKHSS